MNEASQSIAEIIENIYQPQSMQKLWKHIREVNANEKRVNEAVDIHIEIDPFNWQQSKEKTSYLEERLKKDFPSVINVSENKDNRYIYCVSFNLLALDDRIESTGGSWRTTTSYPMSEIPAFACLIDRQRKEILYGFEFKSNARVDFISRTQEELYKCALRRLSTNLLSNHILLLAHSIKDKTSVKKLAETIINIPKIWGNVPQGIIQGVYHNKYTQEEFPVYTFQDKKMFISPNNIFDEWGLGLYCMEILCNALYELNCLQDISSLLIRYLKDEHKYVQKMCIVVLHSIGDKDSVEEIIKLINKDRFLYRECLVYLRMVGDARSYDIFCEALKSEWSEVRSLALQGLVSIGDRKAIGCIEEFLKKEQYGKIRKLASRAVRILKGSDNGFFNRFDKMLSVKDDIDLMNEEREKIRLNIERIKAKRS